MKNINISKKKLENLTSVELPNGIISTEADIYKLNYFREVKIFKKLYKTSGLVFENKLFTLEMLNKYKEILPHNFVLPESLITVKREIKGFSLPFVRGINLESFLANKRVEIKTKLLYLKKIGEILEKMEQIRKKTDLDCIYLNDIHASNFIVDTQNQDIKVVDLDSCRICNSKPFLARYLTPLSLFNEAPGKNKYDIYKKELNSKANISTIEMMLYNKNEPYYSEYLSSESELGFVNSNRESDLYCYVILFLNYLYGENVGLFSLEEFYNYIDYLNQIGFDNELLKSIIKIITNAPNDNIGQYLDTITEEQVIKANKRMHKVK